LGANKPATSVIFKLLKVYLKTFLRLLVKFHNQIFLDNNLNNQLEEFLVLLPLLHLAQ